LGTAALLNVPRSLEAMLAALREEGYDLGRAVQVDPVKPKLKAPGTNLLTLNHDGPL
jgi:cobalamin biosynthesis Mg chelatase CobN